MCKMYYLLIEYVRQLNFYFMNECDSDCELYVDIYTMYYAYDFTITCTVYGMTDSYKFTLNSDELYNDEDEIITLDTVLNGIYQFAINHTDNINIKNDTKNNVPHIIFERAKKYLHDLF